MKKTAFSIIAAAILLSACSQGNSGEQVACNGNGTVSCNFSGTVDYDTYFTGERLRLDFVLAGDKENQYMFLNDLHKEKEWAGNPNTIIDPFGYGQYYFEAFAGDQLIYSKGFSTLFEEWRTTPQAEKVQMANTQTIWMPFPKQTITVKVYERHRDTGLFYDLFQCEIDPTDTHIIQGSDNDFNVIALQYKGDSKHKVDLVFAGEAYTKDQMPKLRKDAERMMEYLFTMEPYAHRRDDFNVWLVESISEDGGVDIPNWGQWRRTAMNSCFDTFYEDRYLTIMNHSDIADAVANASFDTIFIIANETKYGGGGIFNSYALGTSDNEQSDIVFIHEFGHSFAGLGDEYYTSAVAYENYYPLGIEPWEPNITNLTDFASKWEDMVEEGTPVPTPDDKDNYYGVVGVFEGAGYMAKGCFRPYYECRMMNNTAPCFCPVCQREIEKMIDYYVK